MKIWKYVLKLSIAMTMVLFVWQLLLITLKARESFNGILSRECSQQFPSANATSIPRLIHQMWKNADLSSYPIINSHNEWKRLYPNYEVRLWTDEQIEQLLLRREYHYLHSIYHSYLYSIQRADLARLVILHFQGGIYADLDVFPCSHQVEELRLTNLSFIVPRSTRAHSLINHFLLAQKSSKILDYILHQLTPRTFSQTIFLLPYLEVFSTGSFFLTRVLHTYLQMSNREKDSLGILSDNDVNIYITHRTGRSWHLYDGLILNSINDQPRLYLFLCMIFLFSSFLLYKYTFLLHKFDSR